MKMRGGVRSLLQGDGCEVNEPADKNRSQGLNLEGNTKEEVSPSGVLRTRALDIVGGHVSKTENSRRKPSLPSTLDQAPDKSPEAGRLGLEVRGNLCCVQRLLRRKSESQGTVRTVYSRRGTVTISVPTGESWYIGRNG